jgi:hypothetical protein
VVFLRNFYRHKIVEVEEAAPKSDAGLGISDNAYDHIYVDTETAKRLLGSKILLIGEGIIKNKLVENFRKVGIQFSKISSPVAGDQYSEKQTNANRAPSSPSLLYSSFL